MLTNDVLEAMRWKKGVDGGWRLPAPPPLPINNHSSYFASYLSLQFQFQLHHHLVSSCLLGRRKDPSIRGLVIVLSRGASATCKGWCVSTILALFRAFCREWWPPSSSSLELNWFSHKESHWSLDWISIECSSMAFLFVLLFSTQFTQEINYNNYKINYKN